MTKHLPYIFVSYRVINNTDTCIAVFKSTLDAEQNVIIYKDNEHHDATFDYILYETRPARMQEFQQIADLIREIYQVPKLGRIISVKDINNQTQGNN